MSESTRDRIVQTMPEEASPAALALATSLRPEDFMDVYRLARIFDGVATEARLNERLRIFKMGFWELTREMWRSKKLYRPHPFA